MGLILLDVCSFSILYARHRDASVTIEKFLLNPPLGEKGRFLWLARVCAILEVL